MLGRADARQGDRPLEQPSGRVGVQQEGAELVAEIERSVGHLAKRLDVEVGPGEPPLTPDRRIDRDVATRIPLAIGDDGERHTAIGIAQDEGGSHLDPTRATVPRGEVGLQLVDAQQEVGGVLTGTESVVGQRQQRTLRISNQGGEALHRLAPLEWGRSAVGGPDELPRGRPLHEVIRRQHRDAHQLRRGCGLAASAHDGHEREA